MEELSRADGLFSTGNVRINGLFGICKLIMTSSGTPDLIIHVMDIGGVCAPCKYM